MAHLDEVAEVDISTSTTTWGIRKKTTGTPRTTTCPSDREECEEAGVLLIILNNTASIPTRGEEEERHSRDIEDREGSEDKEEVVFVGTGVNTRQSTLEDSEGNERIWLAEGGLKEGGSEELLLKYIQMSDDKKAELSPD